MHCHRNSRARGRSEGRTWPNPISGSSEQNCFLKFRHRSEILNPLCAVSLFLIHQQYIPRIAIWTAQNSLEFSCAFNGDVRHNQVRLFAHWARNHGRRINRQKFPGSNPLFVMSGSLMVAVLSHGRRSLPLHFLCRGVWLSSAPRNRRVAYFAGHRCTLSEAGEGRAFPTSIQRPAEPQHGDGHRDQHQSRERGDVEMQDGERGALEHDGADDADEMGERQRLADPLRP